MATVTGLTAARMAAIEAASITSGTVQGDNLILTRQNGTTINAGNVRGLQGPQGPPGPAGSGAGDMLKSENLSGLTNYFTARNNLGLGPLSTLEISQGDTGQFLRADGVWAPVSSTVVDWKQSVRVATTVNITLSGTPIIDGIQTAVGNRVLVRNQTQGQFNGIYVVASGSWERASDANINPQVTPGMCVVCEEGTANGGRLFVLNTAGPITLGTTPLNFTTISGSGGGDMFKSENLSGLTSPATARTNLGLGPLATLAISGLTSQFLRGDGTWATPSGGGTNLIVEEGDVSVVSIASVLDFGAGFDVTNSPTGEANIALDLSEVQATFDEMCRAAILDAIVGDVSATDTGISNNISIDILPDRLAAALSQVLLAGTGISFNYDIPGLVGVSSTGGGSSNLDVNFPVTLAKGITSETVLAPAASTSSPIGYLRAPWAFTLNEVRAFQLTPDSTTATIIDIHLGPSGSNSTILGNKITIDATERSSVEAAVQSTIVTSIIPSDGELWFYLDQRGDASRGIVVWLLGTRNLNQIPAQVTGLTVTRGNQQNVLNWSNTAGATLPYVVQFSTNGGSTWSDVTGETTTNSFTHTGLTNGTTYTYRVAAVNASGQGAWSSTANGTPGAVPNQVTGLTIGTIGANTIALTWVAPASNGNAITDYVVQYKLSSEPTTWTTFNDGISTTTSTTVVGLTASSAYDFRVAAVNSIGQGSYSTTASASTASGGGNLPTAPIIDFVSGTNGNYTIEHTNSGGGGTPLDVEFQRALASAPNDWSVSAFDVFMSPISFLDPTGGGSPGNGVSLLARIRYVNASGTGPWSNTYAFDNVED